MEGQFHTRVRWIRCLRQASRFLDRVRLRCCAHTVLDVAAVSFDAEGRLGRERRYDGLSECGMPHRREVRAFWLPRTHVKQRCFFRQTEGGLQLPWGMASRLVHV